MVELITCTGGNLGSLERCLSRLGIEYRPVSRGGSLSGDVPVILPGVGSFGAAMASLIDSGLPAVLSRSVSHGTRLLGICIGMQVLFDSSDEAPGTRGLGLIPGPVRRFQRGKVPQTGWNRLLPQSAGWPSGYAYFVNSYHCDPEGSAGTEVLYESDYHGRFCAAVRRGSVTGFQFHPEKSAGFGHGLLERWVRDAL